MHSVCSDSFQGPRVLDVETLLERELKTSEVQIIQYHKFCRLTTKGVSIISAQACLLHQYRSHDSWFSTQWIMFLCCSSEQKSNDIGATALQVASVAVSVGNDSSVHRQYGSGVPPYAGSHDIQRRLFSSSSGGPCCRVLLIRVWQSRGAGWASRRRSLLPSKCRLMEIRGMAE